MSAGNWGDVFASVYDPHDLSTVRRVTDNGRDTYYLHPLSAEGTWEINNEGGGSITLSGNDRDAYPLIRKGDHIVAVQHSDLASKNLTVADFIATEIQPSVDENGNDTIVISGPGPMRELKTRQVMQDAIDDGAGGPDTASLSTAMGYAPYRSGYTGVSKWKISHVFAAAGGDYLAITKQTVFDAVLQMASQAGYNIRYNRLRLLTVIKTPDEDCGIDILQVTDANYASVQTSVTKAPLISCQRHTDHGEFFTRAYVEGGKVGDDALGISDMDYSGITIPAGYTVYWSSNLIVNTSAESSSGLRIEKYLEFPEIKPADDGSTTKQSAQEQLLAAAFTKMDAAATKTHNYTVTTVLNEEVQIGQTIYVKYEKAIGSETVWEVDDHLYIHGLSHRADERQERLTTLELSTDPIPVTPLDGLQAMLEVITGIKTAVDNTTNPTTGSGGTPGADHGGLTGLEDDDHQQYLLASGSRELGGNLSVAAGKTIDGVDLSAHVADSDAHHNRVSLGTSAPAGSLGLAGGQVLSMTLGAGDGIQFVGNEIAMLEPTTITYQTTNEANSLGHSHAIDATADGLNNYGKIARYADNNGGLTVGALAVGGTPRSTGRITLADGKSIRWSDGDGLIETFAGTAGDLTIKADAIIKLQPDSASGTGMIEADGNVEFQDHNTISSVSGKHLYIEPGNILYLQPASNLVLNPTAQIQVGKDIHFQGGHAIYTTSGDLELAPVGAVNINPVGSQVELFNNSLLSHDGWASGWKGSNWGISADGHIDARSIYVDELWARYFNVDYTLVRAGSLVITPSGSKMTRNIASIPAVGSSTTLYVEDKEGLPGAMVFAEEDYCEIRVWEIGTGAIIASIFGQVYDYNDEGGGEQSWTFTVRDLGVGSAGMTIKSGNEVIDYGQSGDSFINMTVNDQAGSPYLEFARWYDNPYTPGNIHKPLRLGDLGGITGSKGVMGYFVGDQAGPHILLGEADLEGNGIHGMPFTLYSDGANTGQLKLCAVEVTVDYGSGTDTMRPNGDVSATNIEGSGIGDLYAMIDDDPDSPNVADWIANEDGKAATATFDLQGMSSSFTNTEKVEIKVYVTVPYDLYGNCRLLAEIVDNTDNVSHTSLVELANHDSADGAYSAFVRPLEPMGESDWDGAWLRLHWHFQAKTVGNPAINLDPRAPYMAVGVPAPSDFAYATGSGLWTGVDTTDDTFKFRLGGGGSSGLPRITWNGQNLQITDGNDTPVIVFESTGDSYFRGTMTIDTLGEIVTDHMTLDADGIAIENPVSGTYVHGEDQKIKFIEAGTTTVRQYIKGFSGPDYTLILGSDNGTYESELRIDSNDGFRFDSDGPGVVTIDVSEGLDVKSGGIFIGPGAASNNNRDGQMVIDLYGNDYEAFLLNDGVDVNHSIEVGTYIGNDTYASMSKYSATNGGLILRGLTEHTVGLSMSGLTQLQSSTKSGAAIGAVMLSAYNDTAAIGSSNNAVVLRSGSTARWIMEGSGSVYMASVDNENNFDAYDDVHLVRAAAGAIGTDLIQDEWDAFLKYNQDDLHDLNIVLNSGFIHQQNMIKLLCGALWQVHKRIAQLENGCTS